MARRLRMPAGISVDGHSQRKRTNLNGIVWYGAGELGESVYGEKADMRPLGEGISGTFTAIILRVLRW